MKINFGKTSRHNTHNMPFNNFTSASFGFVQPLFQQYMNSKDKLSFEASQIVRLSAMPVPTLGKLSVHNKFRFVPMCEIYPYYDAFLTGSTVHTSDLSYVPSKLPYITCEALFWSLFASVGSQGVLSTGCRPLIRCGHIDTQNNITWDDAIDWSSSLLSNSVKFSTVLQALGFANQYCDISSGSETTWHFRSGPLIDSSHNLASQISLDSADCIFCDPSITDTSQYNIFLIMFDSNTRRTLSQFIGTGFSYDFLDHTLLDVLPVFAYYKAYFDEFVPTRSISWHSTHTYELINYIAQHNIQKVIDLTNRDLLELWQLFLIELSSTYYTQNTDWVSVHTDKPLQDSVQNEFVPLYRLDSSGYLSTASVYGGGTSNLPSPNTNVASYLNQFVFDAIRMLTARQTKESYLGGNIYNFIKNKFGAEVADDMFAQSNIAGGFVSDCDVNDVISSADTVNQNSGEYLGAYAGIGIGSGGKKIKYTAPNFGYFIGMMSVVPEANYYQGNDPSLTALERQSMPNTDYDALSYEMTPRSSIYDHSNIYHTFTKHVTTDGFGLIPRLSRWKVKKDIINGCMTWRSTSNSFAPYHLDRIIDSSVVVINSLGKEEIQGALVPDASVAWRYIGRYPQLGRYNRIFYNNGEQGDHTYEELPVDDNFIILTHFDYKLTNCLLPMADSFETYDNELDNGTSSMQAE